MTRLGRDRLPGEPKPPSSDSAIVTVEVSGEERKDKANKVATAKTLWVPAVNNHGGFGRWVFVGVTDVEATKGRSGSRFSRVRCLRSVHQGTPVCRCLRRCRHAPVENDG